MEAIETLEHEALTIRIFPDEIHGDDGPRDWDNAGTMVCWHSRYNLGDKHDHARPHNMLAHLVRECPLDEQSIRELMLDLIQTVTTRHDGTTAKYERDEYRSHFEGMKREQRRAGWKEYLADCIDEGGTSQDLDNEVMERLEANGLVILPLYLYDHGGITMNTSGFSCPWDSGQVGYIYATPAKVLEEWGDGEDAKDKAKQCLEGEVKVYDQFLRGDVYGYRIEDEEGNDLDSCWGFYGMDDVKEQALEAAKAIAGDPERFKGAGI